MTTFIYMAARLVKKFVAARFSGNSNWRIILLPPTMYIKGLCLMP
jgi:hypothetical protein